MRNKASTFISMMGSGTTPPPVSLGYGRLYNWYAVSDAKFAPTDWKVPTLTELQTLETYLGGATVAGGKLKETGTTYWNSPNTGADNSSGFTLYGGGNRSSGFAGLKDFGYFQSQTAAGVQSYNCRARASSAATLINATSKYYGYSVRLLYTGVGTPATLTDYDGNVYDTVVIGTQRWIVQNWKCTKLNDGTTIPEVTDQTTWTGLTSGAWCYYDNDPSYL